MRIKRFNLFIVFLLCVFLVMSGCSKGSISTNGNSKVTLTMLSLSNNDGSLEKIAKDFESENPGVQVKFQSYPFEDLFKQQQVVLNAHDSSADVLYVDGPTVPEFVAKGWLEPLDKYVSKDIKNNWSTSMTDEVTMNGKLYGAPMNSSSQLLYYNIDLLKKSNVQAPSNDVNNRWTWTQLVDAAKKTTGTFNGQKIWGFAFEQSNRAYQLIPLAQSLGLKQLVSDDGLKSSGYTNSPEMIKVGEFTNNLYNAWKITPKIPADQTTDYFTSGKLAFFEGGPWDATTFSQKGLNYGIAPVPYFEGGKPVTPTGSWTVGVSAYSKNKEMAAKFVEYITAGKGADKWFSMEGGLPAKKSLLQQIQTDSKYDKLPFSASRLAAYEDEHNSMLRPKTPGYITWESEVDKAFENIMDGSDPKKAFGNAVENIDTELAKFKQ